MTVDPKELVERGWGPEAPANYTRKDVILYGLGVGASELRYIYENHDEFGPLPSMPFALTFKGGNSADVLPFPPQHFMGAIGQIPPQGPVLDGERSLTLLKQLPTSTNNWAMRSRVTAVSQKRSGVVVESETVIVDKDTGEECARLGNSVFYVGVKGLQSAGEPSKIVIEIPQRPPDREVSEIITLERVQTYRLSGDYNPLHVDDDVAKAFGFPRAIVHGLCTLGHSVRHVIKEFANGDPGEVRGIRCRFSKPVLIGEQVTTKMWRVGVTKVLFRTCKYSDRKEVICLDGGVINFSSSKPSR
ncbi:hypothetical protein FOZ62_002376, partial [Perkinsus olseni]